MFNESQLLKLIFLLADTQAWLNDMIKETMVQLPVAGKKPFLRQDYYLSVTALAHILERHYYKIPRHPGAGKFHIELPEILHYIREAQSLPATPLSGCSNFQRILPTAQPIGFDKNGQPATHITIITSPDGRIVTAFPGSYTQCQ